MTDIEFQIRMAEELAWMADDETDPTDEELDAELDVVYGEGVGDADYRADLAADRYEDAITAGW